MVYRRANDRWYQVSVQVLKLIMLLALTALMIYVAVSVIIVAHRSFFFEDRPLVSPAPTVTEEGEE